MGESKLQRLLTDNAWLFGSEYSELLSRRNWTRDHNLDFMLRRTADDYWEFIESKTPFTRPLFRYDPSHASRNRDHIITHDGCDPLKIRARIIIARDGDEGQETALREFDAHLHRIEVLTFDQLLRIADRVLSVFQDTPSGKP